MIITSKFDGRCRDCGGELKKGDRVYWVANVKGVTHPQSATCDMIKATRPAPKPTGVTINGSLIVKFLTAARERGKAFPNVTFLTDNGASLNMYLAGAASKYPGAVQVKLNGEWIGRIETSGSVAGKLAYNAGLLALINDIAADPVKAAQIYARNTDHCSFCGKKLTDDRSGSSVEVGYGPVCAEKFGLPHAPKGKKKTAAQVIAEVSSELLADYSAVA
jgi:hypothetical protein